MGFEYQIECLQCGILITEYNEDVDDSYFQGLHNNGAVPVPNLGWFCSQNCALDFEMQHNVVFQRNSDGIVDYY